MNHNQPVGVRDGCSGLLPVRLLNFLHLLGDEVGFRHCGLDFLEVVKTVAAVVDEDSVGKVFRLLRYRQIVNGGASGGQHA